MSFFDEVSKDDLIKELEEMSDEEFLRKAQKAGLIEEHSNKEEDNQ